ncbi:hypothetical protein Nmel_013258 [Mimus melanotis]
MGIFSKTLIHYRNQPWNSKPTSKLGSRVYQAQRQQDRDNLIHTQAQCEQPQDQNRTDYQSQAQYHTESETGTDTDNSSAKEEKEDPDRLTWWVDMEDSRPLWVPSRWTKPAVKTAEKTVEKAEYQRLQRVIPQLSEVAKTAEIPGFTHVVPLTVTELIFKGRPGGTWELNPIIFRNRNCKCNRCILCLPVHLHLICGKRGIVFDRNSNRVVIEGSSCDNCYSFNIEQFMLAVTIIYNCPPEEVQVNTFSGLNKFHLCKQVWALKKAIQQIRKTQLVGLEHIAAKAWVVQKEKGGIVEEIMAEKGHNIFPEALMHNLEQRVRRKEMSFTIFSNTALHKISAQRLYGNRKTQLCN